MAERCSVILYPLVPPGGILAGIRPGVKQDRQATLGQMLQALVGQSQDKNRPKQQKPN
jgi:hypothetical protein